MDMGVASIIVAIIGSLATLTSIFISSHNTRSEVAHKLDTAQQLQKQETEHLKNEIKEMKEDIRSHNNYAKLFSENICFPNLFRIFFQMKVANHRIDDLERRMDNNSLG